jgi:hypothetical protein
VNVLLGDLAAVNLAPTSLKVDLPALLETSEIEVIVEVRQGGNTVGQGLLKRPAPGSGMTSKLTLELKRG